MMMFVSFRYARHALRSSLSRHCGLVLLPWLPPFRFLGLCALSFQDGIRYLLDPRYWLPSRDELYNVGKRGWVRRWRFAGVRRRRQGTSGRVITGLGEVKRPHAVGLRWGATTGVTVRFVRLKVYGGVVLSTHN